MKLIKTLQHNEEKEIKELLLYRKIVGIKNKDTFILDNGTELEIRANDGCSGCEAGNYWIEHINFDDNVITDVRQEVEEEEEDAYNPDCTYHIFVLSADREFKILSVKGNDGNGYYGTGFEIKVKVHKEEK
jgi:Zn finger protein HypA/HybF involved in hydrogenase expression